MTHLQKNMTEEGFIKILDDPRPRNIRRALKEGIIVTEDKSELSLQFLYKTHQKNIKAINGIPKSKKFFLSINSFLRQNDWKLFVAKKNDLAIAALLLFYFNETVEYYTPAILEGYRNTQATSLIILKAMVDAANSGYKNWNWGGTWLDQGGVYDYKKKWSTDKYSYYYFNKVFEKSIFKEDVNFFLKNYSGFYVLPFNKLKIEK